MNLCVNTYAGASSTQHQYSIYKCNDAGDVVTREFYNTDETCTTLVSSSTFTDTTLTPGAFNSFSCTGDVDYVITKSTLKSPAGSDPPTCCEDDPVVETGATNICFQKQSGNYSMAECDSTGNGNQWKYADAECTQKLGDPVFKYNNTCQFFASALIYDVYYRIDTCYENGTEIAYNALCDGPTAPPTIAPTIVSGNMRINVVFVIFSTLFTTFVCQ